MTSKIIQQIEDLDNVSYNLLQYIRGIFIDEYLDTRQDIDYKFKKQIIDLLDDSYVHIYAILINKFLDNDKLKLLAKNLTRDLLFLDKLLEEYIEIVSILPTHHLMCLQFIKNNLLETEKYEVLSNINKFFNFLLEEFEINGLLTE
jgi:hypothetical protein